MVDFIDISTNRTLSTTHSPDENHMLHIGNKISVLDKTIKPNVTTLYKIVDIVIPYINGSFAGFREEGVVKIYLEPVNG